MEGIRGPGTVFNYRRLVEFGVPATSRPFRLAERVFFPLLSKADDPKLLYEFKKHAQAHPRIGPWARSMMQQGVAAALAEAGRERDPRVRGAAQRILNGISQFLRSDLAAKPLVKHGTRYILHPDASPPTVFAMSLFARLPAIQRERGGLVDRLGQYLSAPAPKKSYVMLFGRKVVKPTFYLLGEPLHADSAGNAKDLPFALHWIEILARLGVLHYSGVAQRILARLLRNVDEEGVWSPKGLRSLPKSSSHLADFAFPLEGDTKTAASKRADVTFRLALIAKILKRHLEYT